MFRSVLVFSLSLVLLCSLAVHGTSTTTKAPDNKLSEAGWALAGAGLNALADSLNGEGVRYDPVVANEQLPPVPTSGCRPSPQNMDFRFAFEISSSQVKRLVTEAGMNAMIPPLPAGENGNFHQLLKENFGQKLFEALADAVPDAGIGLVLGTFKGNDLLGSGAISNSKMGLLGVNHKKSKEPSIYELIEDAYQGTDPSLTAFGQFISRDEKGRFIAGVNNNEHGLEELNEAKKASVLRAYDTLLDNSGSDLELKHSLISGPKVFSQWPRMIPHTAAKLIQNDHHDLSAFIRTVHHIINHTEAGVFAHRNHSKSHTHTLSSEKKSPLDFFRTNGLSDLNCNTIPVDPNHNYFITGIFASLPGVGDFKFCFALNTCDQMGGIAFTPAPIGQFLPPPLDVIVETIEDFSVAVSLKSYLSLTFVPFWVGESRPEFHATMGGTLGTHILLSIPRLTFLPEKFQKVFGLKLNGLVMYDLDPNHDGGLAASLTDIFSNPKPSAMFTKLIEALKNQKDLAIGIKTYGELTLTLSELSHGILPDLTVGAMGQLMLAVNVKESSSLSNGLFFRSQASAGDIARFIEKLLNTLSAGALKKQVHKIMEKVAQNLVTKLDIFLKGHEGSWGIRIQLGQLILSAEYSSDDRFKLCANGHCLTVPFLMCIKDKQDFVGIPMSCKEGFEEVAGLCATKCETGFKRIGFSCVFQNCKTGYSDNGANCVTNEVGSPPTHCPVETERIGSSCFESCRPGYISEGEICAKPCSANHTLDSSGLSCVSSIVRDHYPRTFSSMSCRPGEERIGSSCLQPCSAGYISDGSTCIKSCPINYNYTIDSSGVMICKSSQSTHRLPRISSPQSPSTCGPLDERIGSSCYPPCSPGYSSQGTFCISSCPPNSALDDSGQYCVSRIPRKNVYRRWSIVLPDGNCRPGEVRQGSSCLEPCPSGYVSEHPSDILCVEPCPRGYNDGFAYEYCESRMFTHRYDRSPVSPSTTTSCPPNEERIGSSCYRQCPSGYLSQGSFCVSACPANHTLDSSGLSCVSSIVRDHYPRTSSSMSCRPDEERIGSSCFQPCSAGYISEGSSCIKSCPINYNYTIDSSGQKCVSTIPRVLYHRSFVPTLLKCPIGKALSEELCYSTLPRFYPKQQSVVVETLSCSGGTQRLSETDHLCYPSRCASGYDWSYDRKHTKVHCKSHCPDNFEHDHGDTCCHSKFAYKCNNSPKLRCDTSNPNTGALIDENL